MMVVGSSPKRLCRSLGVWPRDSVEPGLECFTHVVMQGLVPLLYVTVSVALVAFGSLRRIFNNDRLAGDRLLATQAESVPIFHRDTQYDGSSNKNQATNPTIPYTCEQFLTTPQQHNTTLVFLTCFQTVLLVCYLLTKALSLQQLPFLYFHLITVICWFYATFLVVLNDHFTYLYHLRGYYVVSLLVECFKLRTQVVVGNYTLSPKLEVTFFSLSIVTQIILVVYSFLLTPLKEVFNLYARNCPTYPCPEAYESVLSIATFSWVMPLLRYGYHQTIEPADVWDLRPEEKCQTLCEGFLQFPLTLTFLSKIILYFKRELVCQAFFSLVTLVFGFAMPIILHEFLVLMEDNNRPIPFGLQSTEYATYLIVSLFIFGSLKSVTDCQALFYGRRVGIQVKSIVMGQVYDKTLRRKDQTSLNFDESTSNPGKITNFLSVDAHEIAETCCYLNYFYTVPLQIGFTSWYLYVILGWSSLVGLAVTLIVLPLNYKIALYWETIQTDLMSCSDKRMDLINELLQAIRIIKFFAWERQFQRRIDQARQAELQVLTKRMYVWIVGATVWFCFPMLITVATFLSYTKWAGNTLTPTVAFTSMMIFKALKEPVDQLPEVTNMLLQAKVSLNRIDKFLKEDETKKTFGSSNPILKQ